jgi:hypothetical protein
MFMMCTAVSSPTVSSSGVAQTVLRKVVEDELQNFSSSVRLPFCVNFPFFALRARHLVLMCSGFFKSYTSSIPCTCFSFSSRSVRARNSFHDVVVDHPYSVRCNFTCRVLNERLPPSVFGQNGARCFGVLYGCSRRFAYSRDKGFPERWKSAHQQ